MMKHIAVGLFIIGYIYALWVFLSTANYGMVALTTMLFFGIAALGKDFEDRISSK